ncbi:MAG: DEAD/DEAH box helicase [Anaerolineales bacterium]
MPLDSLLDFWKRDSDTAPNLVAWRTLPPRPAQTLPFPTGLPAPLSQALIASGIHSLYSHQLEAWRATQQNQHIILCTGTASGKTLAYNLPVISELLTNPNSRSLSFSHQALTQDQLSNLQSLVSSLQLSRSIPVGPIPNY